MASKYDPLTRWLESRGSDDVTLTFPDLEELVGPLPASARSNRTWWGNSTRNPQGRAWLGAGRVVSRVDHMGEKVTFTVGAPVTRGGSGRAPILDGAAALEQMLAAAGWLTVEQAVAAHTVFLHPDTVAQTGARALFPVVRDPTRRGAFGELPDGRPVMYDDNTTPTDAFLWAANRTKGPDVQFNHVWGRSDDPDCYTALWNICCTPAFLAKTSDTHRGVVAVLQYRAYELYGQTPAGVEPPAAPPVAAELEWAPMPPAAADLEALLRRRLGAGPKRRAARVARTIGWLYSSGPDHTV